MTESISDSARHRKSFTLMEILVTVSIITILIAFLLPALQKAREKARQGVCMNNLKQIGTAIFLYAQDNNEWLPVSGTAETVAGTYRPNWRWTLCPYMGKEQNNYNCEYGVFWCPSKGNKKSTSIANGYSGFYGGYGWNESYMGHSDAYPDGSSPSPRRRLSQIPYPSKTVIVGDTQDDVTTHYDPFYIYYNNPGNRHSGGINFLWVDGHVSWHKADIYLDWFNLP